MVSTSTAAAARSSGTTGGEVKTGMGIMGMPCTSQWDRWELQCFADCGWAVSANQDERTSAF
jgi:hypothetical protein